MRSSSTGIAKDGKFALLVLPPACSLGAPHTLFGGLQL
jgi:hypothetical protein